MSIPGDGPGSGDVPPRVTRPDEQHRPAPSWTGVAVGDGAGVGLTIGVLLGGGAGIAMGLTIGAGVGVAVGAAIDGRRHPG